MDRFKTASVSHVSSSTRPAGLSSFEVAERWFGEKVPRYILSISTIEPRKNYTGLIDGWQKMRHQTGGDIKLVIIGRLGRMNEEILKEMKPHVASGRLLHLEEVPSHNLPDWFKNATCFASLSYSEGFGMPPIEAMMCGCPVLVSDIPAHRYVASNAAYYCDPYDVDDIAQRLRHITSSDNHGEVSNMTRLGIENAKRFTSEMIIPQWEELIEQRRRSTKIVA